MLIHGVPSFASIIAQELCGHNVSTKNFQGSEFMEEEKEIIFIDDETLTPEEWEAMTGEQTEEQG